MELWFGTMHPLVSEICHRLGVIYNQEINPHTKLVHRLSLEWHLRRHGEAAGLDICFFTSLA